MKKKNRPPATPISRLLAEMIAIVESLNWESASNAAKIKDKIKESKTAHDLFMTPHDQLKGAIVRVIKNAPKGIRNSDVCAYFHSSYEFEVRGIVWKLLEDRCITLTVDRRILWKC